MLAANGHRVRAGSRRPSNAGPSPCRMLGRVRGIRMATGASAGVDERADIVLAIASAVLFFIAFLINAAEISTNDTFTSTNIMLLGLMVLALQLAGVGSGWSARGRRR